VRSPRRISDKRLIGLLHLLARPRTRSRCAGCACSVPVGPAARLALMSAIVAHEGGAHAHRWPAAEVVAVGAEPSNGRFVDELAGGVVAILERSTSSASDARAAVYAGGRHHPDHQSPTGQASGGGRRRGRGRPSPDAASSATTAATVEASCAARHSAASRGRPGQELCAARRCEARESGRPRMGRLAQDAAMHGKAAGSQGPSRE